MPLPKVKTVKTSDTYFENIQKPLFKLNETELREILDLNWYPRADNALHDQRLIWDYSYLAYKGIMTHQEINRKRRANGFGIYVNVPRTFMTIEGIRRNFNISKLKVNLDPIAGLGDPKRLRINSFLNWDLKRSKTFKQVKDAGFYKLLFGNGFLYTYLSKREGKFGKITGGFKKDSAVVQNRLDQKNTIKYFGMVSRAVSPYKVFPDPDGVTVDYNDTTSKPCEYHCIRDTLHINNFKRKWRGIIPDKILDEVEVGGDDMTDHEAVKDMIDEIFRYDRMRYPGTVEDVIGTIKRRREKERREFVEERIWIGEDFLIVQAGKGLKFCMISPNPNPKKLANLTKLDNVGIPDEYWKMGEPYLIRYQQVEENRVHNATLDTVHHSIAGMVGINTNYLEDEYDLDIYPQKVWKFKPIPGVKMDEMIQQYTPSSNNITAAMKFMQEVKETSQSTSSITDFVTGASKSIADTATEANKLAGASDLAIADKIKEMAEGALTDVARIFLSMYPHAYSNEDFDIVANKQKIKFIGKTKKEITEKKLANIMVKDDLNAKQLIFLDDVNVTSPTFSVSGNVSLNRGEKLREWNSAGEFAAKINEQAFATGDPRRIDTVKMGLMALENFDVIEDPNDFLLVGQPVKTDEIKATAAANKAGQNTPQAQNGGRTKKVNPKQARSSGTQLRQQAQPKNRNKNESTKK